jgi:hypothetical protein
VGINAFMGMHIVDNSENVTHYVVQSNDVAVVHQFRGRNIFTSIATDFEEHDTECEYSIGIPNDNSYKGFIKMGWKDVVGLKCLSLKQSKRSLLNQPFKISLRNKEFGDKYSNYDFRIDTKVYFDTRELARINKSSEVQVVRDNDYINWKLSNKNGYIISMYNEEELVGYLIFHVIRNRKLIWYNHICIDDWYYADVHMLKCLLEHVSKWAIFLTVPIVNEGNNEYRDFIQCGFEDLSKPSRLVVSPRAHGHEYLNKLSFRMLDVDYILN